MEMVGSEIFWNGIASACSGEHRVSPMWRSEIPEMATMEPIGCFTDLNFVQTVKLIELADLYSALLVRLMMVDKDAVLIDLDGTVVYFTDTDTSNVFVIVDGTDQNLGSGSLGSPSGAGI